MAPKKFVPLAEPAPEPATVEPPTVDQCEAAVFGRNYPNYFRSVNATVSHPDVIKARRDAQKAAEEYIAQHAEYTRVPKGERKVKHQLPMEESYEEDGSITLTRPKTTTRRTDR